MQPASALCQSGDFARGLEFEGLFRRRQILFPVFVFKILVGNIGFYCTDALKKYTEGWGSLLYRNDIPVKCYEG